MEYIMVEQHIDMLEAQLRQTKPHDGDDFKEMWGLVKVIGAGFKAYRWNTHEAKNVAWARHQALVDELKAINDGYRVQYDTEKAVKNAEWDSKRETSAAHTADLLLQADAVLKAGADSEQPLKAKSAALQAVRTAYRELREQILREDGEQIRQKLDAVAEKLSKEWDAFKIEQEQKYKQRQLDRERGAKEWAEKQKHFFQILEDKLYRKENLLKIIETELFDLRDKQMMAQSDTFKEKATGWIIEKEERRDALVEEIAGIKIKLDAHNDAHNKDVQNV
jgi:hypothetical protein